MDAVNTAVEKPATAPAEAGCMPAEPQEEHRWLHQLEGEWTYEHECIMAPGQPPMKATGTHSVRSLGGLWIIGEGKGEMPGGGPATVILTLGYDPQRKRFVGTFIGSMMTHLWTYDGALDGAKKVLTLDAEGPSFAGDGTIAKYQDIVTIESDDHWTLSSQVLGENGTWNRFMTGHYRRQK
jgi:Protein of unknown function (DUF1579)